MHIITDNANIRAAMTELRAECRHNDDADAVDLIDAALDGDEAAAVEVLSMLGDARAADDGFRLRTAVNHGAPCVTDIDGGVWHASDEVADIIGDDRLAMLAVCDIAPMLGTWHD